MNKNPTKTAWRRLYTAAKNFRDLAPWDWTEDDRIFGVKNTETGQIDYCVVLGALGEVFALMVYEGHEGLQGYLKLLQGELEEGPHVVEHQKGLMASFENRSDLAAADLTVIRSLNLKFRGKNNWPMFRHYLPGYMPWFLNASQAEVLANCLEQSLDVLPRYRQDPALLQDPVSGSHLVRVLGKKNGREAWHDEILAAPEPVEDHLPYIPADEVGLARIQRQDKKHLGTWEVGYCYAPMPIQERRDERPYFPRLLAIVHAESGLILTFELGGPDDRLTVFRDRIMSCLENQKTLPEQFLVDHDEAATLIEPIAKTLGIILHRVRELPAFTEALDALVNAS